MSKIGKSLYDVKIKMEFEIGRTQLTLGEFVNLKRGTPIKLEESDKGLIRIYTNGAPFAYGEALKGNGERYIGIIEILNKEA